MQRIFSKQEEQSHTAGKIAEKCKQGELFVIFSSLLPHVLLAGLLCIKFLGQKFVMASRKGKEKTQNIYYLVKLVNQFHICMTFYNVCLRE